MNADTLRLASRPPVEDEIENWDDDDFLIEGDDLTFQSQTNSTANIAPSRRDSQSSFRSDFESVHGGEEEKHVHLPGDDEKSTLDAIAAAAKAGIPIPKNVPPSALMGGTIKRLGGRKIKKIIQEDWVDDLEFPDSGQSLQIKPRDGSQFPDALRQVSNPMRKPPKDLFTSIQEERKETASPSISNSYIDLERFRDNDDNDDDFFGDGVETIKMPKKRQPRPISIITPPTPKPTDADDDFEKDFELPVDGKLKLSARKDVPKTPTFNNMLDDLDWTEGSLGTRFGGTRRDVQSTRSSVSAMSPSVASSMTFESEDETFDGLILPNGPLDFGERLMRRRQSRSPIRIFQEPIKEEREEEKEDFVAGLEIGDGEIFDSRKLTLHRNIQVKATRPSSPSRPKASVALKFTNKPVGASRLPRPMGPAANSERSHAQSSLEPVSESGGPITQTSQPRRPLSRVGHSAQSSVNSVNSIGSMSSMSSMGSINSITSPPTPSSTHTVTPSTPSRRRELNQKSSAAALRSEPTTTNAQLLRLKRSLPAMRAQQSPARPAGRTYERPPSRTDYSGRPQPSTMRPKTPVERMRTSESSAAAARKGSVPFLPAGASASQSHNVNARSLRGFRRHDSDASVEFRPASRAVSRSTIRSPSPRRYRPTEKPTPEGTASWGRLSMPRRVKNFGDGHELDGFDDLPTSTQAEAQFLKQPVITNGKSSFRGSTRNYQTILPDRTIATTPSPNINCSPRVNHNRVDSVPSFARDTTASRIAREASIAQRTPSGPLAPLTTQRVAQLSARNNLAPQPPNLSTVRAKKSRRAPQQSKPHLISNLNPPKDPKLVKGMWYNPDSFRWEGNDNALRAFDAPSSTPSTSSIPQYLARERESATPRPALITNIGATKGVQVVGGMIFDPQAMCWLKAAPPQKGGSSKDNDPLDGFNALDDEDDVFKDIPDLEERTMASSDGGNGRSTDLKDDWLVGEEFDVGPEFVRRQREEEDRWRKKCSSWISNQVDRGGDAWKWAIRDIVNQSLAD